MLKIQPYEKIQYLDRSGGVIEMFFSTAIYKYRDAIALHDGCVFCGIELGDSAKNSHVTFQGKKNEPPAQYVADLSTIDAHLSNNNYGIHKSYYVCRECFESRHACKFQIVPIV